MDSSFRRSKTSKLRSGQILSKKALSSRLRGDSERKLSKKDRISRLPNDILVYILSFLTMKDVVSTSLLSKRWRHIWAYAPRLIFDSHHSFDCYEDELLEMETKKYIHQVDKVVNSYKAPIVNEFKLYFFLDEDSKDNIDKWVEFAVKKGVKTLELHFGSSMKISSFSSKFPYIFPNLSLCNSLTSLQLAFVEITREVLEGLIYSCKALEILSVVRSKTLVALKIVGPSLNLKSLRLHCHGLANLEIYAPKLVFMHYWGPQLCGFPFKITPKLEKLSLGGGCIKEKNWMISPFIDQIEGLKLNIAHIEHINGFPNCSRLKTLDITYRPECDKDMFRITSVIKACPFLHTLLLQLYRPFHIVRGKKLKLNEEEPWCHEHLKLVEIVGSAGCAGSALGFARYLVRNLVSLEKLIIDPLPPVEERYPGVSLLNKKITKAREQAELLRANLKPGTELEIR